MKRPLYGALLADAVSVTGTRVSMIAIPLFVLASTGSAARTGLVAAAETLPLILAKVLGGPVIDRVGARRIAVGCDVASLLVVGSIPLLADRGMLPFGLFVALVAVAGALRGPGDAAKSSLIPRVTAAAGVPLERGTGLAGTVERTASMTGAGLAGLLVAAVGPANALVVDAVSFGVSAVVLWWATARLEAGPEVESVEENDPLPYRRQLAEGWRFLLGDRVLLGIAVMVALTNMLDLAFSAVLMPVWAVDSGRGAAGLGLLFAVFSGSSALGALAAATWAARLPRFKVYLVAFLVAGLPRFLALGLDAPWVILLTVFVAGGFASGFLNPILGAVIFERIPEALLGRVSSLTTAMCWSLMPLGGLLGGGLISGLGATTAFVACGVAYFAVTMLPAVDPRWREPDRRPSTDDAHEPAAAESAAESTATAPAL